MDLMSLSARDLSHKCLEAFQLCLTFCSTYPGLSNHQTSHDERFEYRLADFNLWIDGIGALAPSKASLDSRLSERQIDLSLVKGNLIMLFQSLEDCQDLLKERRSLEESLLDIDSALESLVALSLAIRKTGRRSRLHKADRLFKLEEHAELKKHLEAMVLLRPGPGPCYEDDEFRNKMNSLTPLQSYLVTANLKRRNRFIQAHLHSLGLKKRTIGFELPPHGTVEQATASAPGSKNRMGEITMPISAPATLPQNRMLPAPMSVTSASVPESKLEYKEPVAKRTESTSITFVTHITASARYPRPRVSDNEQKVVQCPCCCQTLPVSEAKNNNRWRKHLAEDIRPYTCIFDRCPAPDVYYSSRSMLEQHFRQDHPPVWVCPLCDQGRVYSTMTEMMDHLHNAHAQAMGENVSTLISSSAQMRMGIESCPLCEVKGDADSPELIDHVLEHVHDFSLRSLPWPKSADVDLGGEVGSFNPARGEAVAITQWLEGCEHETDDIDPTLKLSTCDYGRLANITGQIGSQKQDKLGLDIGFADEHGDESAEAETDISQLTQDTLDPVKQFDGDRDRVYCHTCAAEWYRDEKGLTCPECENELVEIIEPENDPRDLTLQPPSSTGPRLSKIDLGGVVRVSKPSARESTSSFRRFANRLFSRKKTVDIDSGNIEPDDEPEVNNIFSEFPSLSQTAYSVLVKLYSRHLDPFIKKRNMLPDFIRDMQEQHILGVDRRVSNLDTFVSAMITHYMDPLKGLPPKDLSKPISNYFINTSHQTLHRALQFGTSVDPLHFPNLIAEALYAGYRSIDIDVWDGDEDSVADPQTDPDPLDQSHTARTDSTTMRPYRPFSPNEESLALNLVASKITPHKPGQSNPLAEPLVADGLTLTAPFTFREACELIRTWAFMHNDLPVIVNISVHASLEQQEMMVKIMKEEWDGILVDEPLEGCDPRFRLPKLEDLRNRILVRLSEATRFVFPDSNNSGKTSHNKGRDYQEHIPIIQPLANLGVYTRNETFTDFNTLWAKAPSHVFSLDERGLQKVIATSRDDLLEHNKNYFFHVMPNSVRAGTSNFDPSQFWTCGVQMAAINRHIVDEGMMLNQGMFTDESGWVLKPDGHLSSDKDTSTDQEEGPREYVSVSVFIFQGQSLEWIPEDGTKQRTQDLSRLTKASIYNPGAYAVHLLGGDSLVKDVDSGAFGYQYELNLGMSKAALIHKLSILRLTFADYSSSDGLIAWTSLRLDRLNQGYRLVSLYGNTGGLFSEQKMLVKFNLRYGLLP
ncbi:hypothetical protein BKA60DRAFT_151878 [Fusarium oxysporum]|nr:hypothetical protein BKA60DRAFT_151878 [Fusarium oxysporum]